MRKGVAIMFLSLMASLLGFGKADERPAAVSIVGETVVPLYGISVTKIDGTKTALGEYKGDLLLIVNVASKCGFTGQYEGLQALYEKYADQGFKVLGFPANNFMNQEPGSNEEIAKFCSAKFNVTFPMFEKISVKGKDMHPLYQFLTSEKLNPGFGGEIGWNFNKFLISREGRVIGRFGSRTAPNDEELISMIEKGLMGAEPK
ncbi:MAG: glutathione peroxidase [Candidatus Eisenbacteria bacterium]|uniref:Glutathione peroxidase n=1 Tax=Eiseniibacteriota bacterium TaxID=2212470 RepID=A0A948RWJ6_UNCEI|nr:glutathione peroxidase [Candidatus Eisenbacteria bacterium]MBU1948530.1 glutathione peroxidase [Candidatus Eisenbacteria bacterium]MBU2690868.1 glutathione peroxidase [Candidatus Eisenbacteria bacterium]